MDARKQAKSNNRERKLNNFKKNVKNCKKMLDRCNAPMLTCTHKKMKNICQTNEQNTEQQNQLHLIKQQFPFWSVRTVKTIFKHLEELERKDAELRNKEMLIATFKKQIDRLSGWEDIEKGAAKK